MKRRKKKREVKLKEKIEKGRNAWNLPQRWIVKMKNELKAPEQRLRGLIRMKARTTPKDFNISDTTNLLKRI